MNDSPRVLGNRYEVGELLGRGGMAEVHLGRDARLGRTVAIKLLRTDLARDPLFQARFRREAQSAAALNHPAIVAVYDTGEEQVIESGGAVVNLPYIVMEHVEGRTLREELGPGQHMGVAQALEITSGVLTALEYSHRIGIVHRDIKPANVMLTPTGDVKVMDFGIARAMSDASSTMTQTQAVIGTAQYLSPEQARGEPVDTRSDLYSAGCLLFELLTGRPPFVADSPVAVAYQHVREEPIPPSRLVPDIPEPVDRIVLHALAKGRDERYQTAAEFRADVDAARAGQQVNARVPAPAGAATTQFVGAPDATGTGAMAPVGAGGLLGQPGAAPSPFEDTYAGYGGEPGRRAQRGQQSSRRGPLIAGLVVLLLLIGVGFAVYLLIGQGNQNAAEISVPGVVGDSTAVASKKLTDAGFKVTPLEKPSTPQQKGQVTSQSPQGSTKAHRGDTVTITVGTGPESVTVPNLRNLTEKQAQDALEQVGLTLGDPLSAVDTSVKADHVVRSDPAGGDQVDKGTQVDIYLSDTRVTVPGLIGLTEAQAKAQLQGTGLKLKVKTEQAPEEDPGTVFDQDPGKGTKVDRGDTITVRVAEIPDETPTPSVTPSASASPSASATA